MRLVLLGEIFNRKHKFFLDFRYMIFQTSRETMKISPDLVR